MKCLILTSVQLRITKLLIDQILTKIVVPWGGRTIGGLGRIGRPRSMENRVQLKLGEKEKIFTAEVRKLKSMQ